MSIGVALVVIFILYLIDKHNRWRQAAKVGAGLLVLALLIGGGIFGWREFKLQREAKRLVQEQAKLRVACLDSAKMATTKSFIPDVSVCDSNVAYRWPPACQNGLVVGCIDDSPQPWKKYGATQIYELDGRRYEVPKGTTIDELEAALKDVSKDADYAIASPEDQKGYLAYVIEDNRKKK
jgi:hypothetical protein